MFFQDPLIQRILHVRGKFSQLLGLNFPIEHLNTTSTSTSTNNNNNDDEYFPELGWHVCNDNIVRVYIPLYYTISLIRYILY
jgi:hypothetical protein